MQYSVDYKITELIKDAADAHKFAYIDNDKIYVTNSYALLSIPNEPPDGLNEKCGVSAETIEILEKRAKTKKEKNVHLDTDTTCEILCIDKTDKCLEKIDVVKNVLTTSIDANFKLRIDIKLLTKISKFLGVDSFELAFNTETGKRGITASIETGNHSDAKGIVILENTMIESYNDTNPSPKPETNVQTTIDDFIGEDNE